MSTSRTLTLETTTEDLHAFAITSRSVDEFNLILNHENCGEATQQMLIAKLHLFEDEELKKIEHGRNTDFSKEYYIR